MTRRLSVPLLLAVLIATAGCLGVLTGREPLTIESNPVSVSSAAQSNAGYEESRTSTQELRREISAAGQTREVIAMNHIGEYSRSIDAGPIGSGEFARFVVVSSPAVELLGRTLNPVGEMSNRELAELAQDQYEGLSGIEEQDARTVTVLGSQSTVTRFSADAEVEGIDQPIDLSLHVARIRDGGDYVVIVAAHPRLLPGETDRVDTLIEGVQHDA